MKKNLLLLIFFSFFSSFGQNSTPDKKSKVEFLPIPYLSYNRSLGGAIGMVPMAMFNLNPKDSISPASLVGGMGLYTTNKTWFGVGFSRLYFKEDNWRVILGGGAGSVNFQFFIHDPIFQSEYEIDFNSQITFFKAEVHRKIWKRLYFGLGYKYNQIGTSFLIDSTLVQEKNMHGISVLLNYDQRDNVYYPYKGFFTNLEWNLFPEFLGNQFVNQRIQYDFNFYKTLLRRDVWASRIFVGTVLGSGIFEQQFIVGNNDLRGYTQGAYRGDQLIALQTEYRWNLHSIWSVVGFGGIATIFNSINPSDDGQILPSVGTGFRVTVSQKNHMNVGLDLAVGKEDWGVYFRIGEAF